MRKGNQEAFGQLVELFQTRLFGLGLMVTRQRSGAEEVAQQAFIRAFRNLHLYDEHRPFYPWLATIGFRVAQNWLKRNTRLSRREGAGLVSSPDQVSNG